MNIQNMMKQAQQMQERMQKQMAELRVEAAAGGGMVTVVMSGLKQVQKLTIDPEANATHGRAQNGRITEEMRPQALVVPTNEELMIALDTAEIARRS